MGMDLKTYLIVGYKTTREEAEAQWGDKFDDLLDENFDDICLIDGEGSDTAIIGKVVASTDEYSDATPVVVDGAIPPGMVAHELRQIGIDVDDDEIRMYLFGVWS